jgi:hypothetical protein
MIVQITDCPSYDCFQYHFKISTRQHSAFSDYEYISNFGVHELVFDGNLLYEV